MGGLGFAAAAGWRLLATASEPTPPSNAARSSAPVMPEIPASDPARVSASAAVVAESRAVRFGAALERRELDAALELWAQLPSGLQLPTWRELVARWLQQHPRDARHLAEVARAAGSEDSFACVVMQWAELSDPASASALVGYAQELPTGAARVAALEAAVRAGTQRDPATVSAWLLTLRDPDELDFAAAHLVTHTDALFRPTAQALEWAALIRDPARRVAALACVVREWGERDRAAATAFVAQSENFSVEQRRELLASLTQRPDPP